VPLRDGTNRDAPETDTIGHPPLAEQSRAARMRRAAALVSFFTALTALAAGIYLLNTPARGLSREAPAPTPARTSVVARVTASPKPAKVTYGRPVRLIIPKLGLNAAVEYVGLTTGGAMAAPPAPDTVGWYKLGPRPGNIGSAVIDGHSGYADGTVAAFDELPRLVKGDRLYVEDANGRRAAFIVTATRLYARNANASDVFASTTGRRLNLITCTGSFDVTAGTHSERLVVFAVLKVPAQNSSGQ
jgi:sortase A